jgi:hypothetical protein
MFFCYHSELSGPVKLFLYNIPPTALLAEGINENEVQISCLWGQIISFPFMDGHYFGS